MATIIYRMGNTHTVDGIKCEMSKCEADRLQVNLGNGWVIDPKDLAKPTKAEADTNGSGKLSSDEVREAAKVAGIDGWEKKRISTLKSELGYDA